MKSILSFVFFVIHFIVNLAISWLYMFAVALSTVDGIWFFCCFVPLDWQPILFIGVAIVFCFVNALTDSMMNLILSKNAPYFLVRVVKKGVVLTTIVMNLSLWVIRLAITIPIFLYHGASLGETLGNLFFIDLYLVVPLTVINIIMTKVFRWLRGLNYGRLSA
jgi:hypothetical protein